MRNRFNHIKANNKKEINTLYEMLKITKKSQISSDPYIARIKEILDWNAEIEVLEEGKESGHTLRVAYLSKRIAEEYGLDEKQVRDIYFAALFRDVGKHVLSRRIIGKPGPLTEEEFEVVKTHPDLAEVLIKDIASREIIAMVKNHHERMDKSGYPRGIVPGIGARIIGLADSYEAMTSERVYCGKKSQAMAFQELDRCTVSRADGGFGHLYDEEFVRILKDVVKLDKSCTSK